MSDHSDAPNRRQLILGTGAAAALAALPFPSAARTTPDHTIRIAPLALEIAPGKVVHTTAYNGKVPGPALRVKEGQPLAINVINDSGYDNLVHWHGLHLPSEQDGAFEEGSP